MWINFRYTFPCVPLRCQMCNLDKRMSMQQSNQLFACISGCSDNTCLHFIPSVSAPKSFYNYTSFMYNFSSIISKKFAGLTVIQKMICKTGKIIVLRSYPCGAERVRPSYQVAGAADAPQFHGHGRHPAWPLQPPLCTCGVQEQKRSGRAPLR